MSFTPTPFVMVLALSLASDFAASQPPLPSHVALASNPNAPVPAVQFRSAFRDTPQGVVSDTLDWKKANAEVGQFGRGHMDVLKWENGRFPVPDAPATVESTKPMKH